MSVLRLHPRYTPQSTAPAQLPRVLPYAFRVPALPVFCRFIKYLYKYFCKGSDRIEVNRSTHPEIEHDEIARFELFRYLCATEAFARAMDIKLHRSSHGVTMVPVHLEGEESVEVGDDAMASSEVSRELGRAVVSKLTRYFLRPRESIDIDSLAARGVTHMDDVTICDYYGYFNHALHVPPSLQHRVYLTGGVRPPQHVRYTGPGDDEDDADSDAMSAADAPLDRALWQDLAVSPQPQHYVWYRSRRHITRLPGILPNRGDIYFLRLLLARVPARSFLDLRTFNGTVYDTYRDAAVARGLVSNSDEARRALAQLAASEVNTPSDLRYTFCVYLMLSSDVADGPALFNEFWEAMSRDFVRPGWVRSQHHIDSRDMSDTLLKLLLMRKLNSILANSNKNGTDYGLPSIQQLEAALDAAERGLLEPEPCLVDQHRSLLSRTDARRQYDAGYTKLTHEQRIIVDYWVSEREAGNTPQIFIDALAGRGKTFVIKLICAWERAQGHIPLVGAYTGIVATLHLGGMTDHRIWGLSIDTDVFNPGRSSLTRGSEMGALHRASSLYAIDEVFMHKCVRAAPTPFACCTAASPALTLFHTQVERPRRN